MHTAKAYQNGSKLNYIHPSMVLSKIFDGSIQRIATRNSLQKMKLAIPHEQNCMAWLVKTSKTVFNKLTQKIYLSVSGKQSSRHASTWPAVFLSQNFRYFPVFYVVILVKYTVLFVLGKCLMDSEQVILIFTEV